MSGICTFSTSYNKFFRILYCFVLFCFVLYCFMTQYTVSIFWTSKNPFSLIYEFAHFFIRSSENSLICEFAHSVVPSVISFHSFVSSFTFLLIYQFDHQRIRSFVSRSSAGTPVMYQLNLPYSSEITCQVSKFEQIFSNSFQASS